MKLPQLTPTAYLRFFIQPFLVSRQISAGIVLQNSNYATTQCHFKSGQMKSEYSGKDAYGPPGCLYKHEQAHRGHDQSCCTRASLCYNKTSDNSCADAYERWFQANIDHNECQAYTAEVSCLENSVKRSGWTSSELSDLNARLSEAKGLKTYHCGRASGLTACPFNSSGDII